MNSVAHTSAPDRSSPVVLVLASGKGERFRRAGGSGSKLDAVLADGRTVLAHTLAAVQASGLPWYVERGAHAAMGDTIAAAVRATAGASGWLVLPADLPLVAPATLRAVADALAATHAAGAPQPVRPVHAGQAGHPVGFPADCAAALLALAGADGARRVLAVRPALLLPVHDAGCVLDIDTPADLLAARQRLLQAPRTSA